MSTSAASTSAASTSAAVRTSAAANASTAASAFGTPFGPQGLPGRGRLVSAGRGGLAQVAVATGTAAGQVVAIGSGPGPAVGAFVEGGAVGTFPATRPLDGPAAPVAACSGYLGDAVLVSTTHARGRWQLAVRSQRHYSGSFTAPRLLPVGSLRPSAVAVAMDYRSEVLVVWASGGEIYARELAPAGVAGLEQRLGRGGPDPELQALISDDGRAIVAWRSQAPTTTSIAVDISGASLRFGAPSLVERFRDPDGIAPANGSLWLARMSSEAVMLAWTGVRAGRYVVRASPVSLHRGVWAPVTISAPSTDTEALLAALVAGPRAEVLALWTTTPRAPRAGAALARRAIVAAWGHYGGHGEAVFAAPEVLAPAGPNGTPAASFDPQNDRALAAWVAGAGSPRIVYAQRTAGPPIAAAGASGLHHRRSRRAPPAVALAALGLLLLAAAAAVRQLSGGRGGRGDRVARF